MDASQNETKRNAPLEEARRYVALSTTFRRGISASPAAEIEIHPLGNGEHNANFWFIHPETGEKLVLRANYISQQHLEHQAAYEFGALEALEPCARAPRPVFVDETREVVPRGMSVISFIEGDELDYEREDDLAEAAAVLADIHSVEVADDCPILKPTDALVDLYEEDTQMYDAYLASAYVDKQVKAYIDHYFSCVKGLLDAPAKAREARRILNTEAVADHFLIPHDTDTGTAGFAHMIDWDKPVLGEAVRDVAYFVSPTTTVWTTDFIFSPAQRSAFVKEYLRIVDGRFDLSCFEERFSAFLKMNALRGMTYCAKAFADYQDPAYPLKNDFTAKKLELYLSEEFMQMLKDDIFDPAILN